MRNNSILLLAVVVFTVTGVSHATVSIDLVTVGNAGNADDVTGYGGVGYEYLIGKYEVTAGQYIQFLNAAADTDTYGLYNPNMDSDYRGCQITRNGTSGNYTYDFSGRPSGEESDWSYRPVNYVSWYDAHRFANWLHNGQGTGDTETGAYTITDWDGTDGTVSDRNIDARVSLPSEDEWYKAAYHKNDGVTSNYFDYPTSSDSLPGRDVTEATNAGNNANYWTTNYLIGSPYYRTEVGEFELSDSPYHTFDQAGNVWEWTEAINTKYPTHRIIRGGSMGISSGPLTSTGRYTRTPDTENFDHGIRVVSVPCSFVIAGDYNDDCKVNLVDFAELSIDWQVSYDISDLAEMVSRWLLDCDQTPGDPYCVPK